MHNPLFRSWFNVHFVDIKGIVSHGSVATTLIKYPHMTPPFILWVFNLCHLNRSLHLCNKLVSSPIPLLLSPYSRNSRAYLCLAPFPNSQTLEPKMMQPKTSCFETNLAWESRLKSAVWKKALVNSCEIRSSFNCSILSYVLHHFLVQFLIPPEYTRSLIIPLQRFR